MDGASVAPLGTGLINDTFAVASPQGPFVLQRLHPVFDPRIHHNIAAVTQRLEARGLATPRLVPTLAGRWWHVDAGAPWRLMTRLPGVSIDAMGPPAMARAAGAALGGFHAALHELSHTFVAMRTGVHDTPTHLASLAAAVQEHRSHRLYDEVAPLAEAIARGARALPALAQVPDRIVHGDPKLSNLLFEGADGDAATKAVGFVDLDTVGPMPLAYELGDAWRSWCNPRGEDEGEAQFRMDVYEASLAGYAGTVMPPPRGVERDSLVHGVEWITLELAARFAADALREAYFGWDAERFAGRGEHNVVRARGQWSLHEAALALRAPRERALQAALA